MAAVPRRRNIIGRRRRVEDEGEDEGTEPLELLLDDDSLTEGSIASDDRDQADDSDTSNIDEASPTSPTLKKTAGNGAAKSGATRKHQHQHQAQGQHLHDGTGTITTTTTTAAAAPSAADKMGHGVVSDTAVMLNGLSISQDPTGPVKEIDFDEVLAESRQEAASIPGTAPIVYSSGFEQPQPPKRESGYERQRREHELYRQKKAEDPAFVPNRGAFFMHDYRGSGPTANGFRPFARNARGRGRGGGFGGPFAPVHPLPHNSADPTISAQWSHDMHEAVAKPPPPPPPPARHHNAFRHLHDPEGLPNGNGYIPTCPPSAVPINRTMSVERVTGTITVRVLLPGMKAPKLFEKFSLKSYTKLPDHRPPLRRDKAVVINLPGHPKRQIFPAIDRSFIFIPRAQRPNQQRLRGKSRSGLGSVSGFSRRTSVFGGSYYGGSVYTPSVALSRRSSIAQDMGGHEFMISPVGSAISRPPPIVRLPPTGARPDQVMPTQPMPAPLPYLANAGPAPMQGARPAAAGESSINDIPPPQTHPLPQKPTFQENQTNTQPSIPMHQPRPQKAVSIETIESPTMNAYPPPQAYQQAFHQQMPMQMTNGYTPEHARHPSYPSHTTGTPLSQIPERAIHAAPFQPTPVAYPQGYYGQPYPTMQPQQGLYYPYPPPYGMGMPPSATAPVFVPGAQQSPPLGTMGQPGQAETSAPPAAMQAAPGSNLVAQEVNGMVYYYDASQLPTVANYAPYTGAQGFMPPVPMGGMMTPSPDAYYYPQQNVVYYAPQ